MKHIKTSAIISTFMLLFLNSCELASWGCIVGNDRIATEERIIGPFTSVASYGSFVVNVEKGTDHSLSIEADENLLPYIRTNIRGNTLILETRSGKCLRSREPIIIDVLTENIDELKVAGSGVINADDISARDFSVELSGSGDINSHNIAVDYLLAKISGSGNINLSGTSETADFAITGSGNIRSIDLITERCYAEISGSGNIYTYVSNLLEVTITGSGNLYYEGNPELKQRITGSGNVRRY